MNAKKIAGFFLMKPAFTQRNITSIGLVGLFFVVYILMGGKVTTELPKMNKGGAFGSGAVEGFINSGKTKAAATKSTPSTQRSAQDILGINESEDRAARGRVNRDTTFFSEDEKKAFENQPLDKDGLVKGVKIKRNRIDWSKKREDRILKKRDMLSDIEERLNMRKRNQ